MGVPMRRAPAHGTKSMPIHTPMTSRLGHKAASTTAVMVVVALAMKP